MGFSIQDYLEHNKIELGKVSKEVGDSAFKGGHNDLRKTNYDVKITEDGKLDLYTHKTVLTESKINEASDKPTLDSRTGLIYYFDIPFTSEDVTELVNGSKSILNAKFTSNRQFEIQPMVFIKDKVNGGNHTFSVSQLAILGAFYNKNKNSVASRKDF
jgi:hypothetical protein